MTFSEEAPLNERQSLDLIQTMIRQAQNRLTDDGSHLIWWGTLVFVAALGHYALLYTAYAEQAGLVWMLMAVGGIRAAIAARQQAQRVSTFADRVMGAIWASVGAGLGLVFLLGVLAGSWRVIYPMVLVLYGIGLFATAGTTRYVPLLLGGVLAVVAALVGFEGQLLCLAGAVAGGFIVPGLLIRSRFQQQQTPLSNAISPV